VRKVDWNNREVSERSDYCSGSAHSLSQARIFFPFFLDDDKEHFRSKTQLVEAGVTPQYAKENSVPLTCTRVLMFIADLTSIYRLKWSTA